jgi:uncharacterized protein
LLYGFQQPQTLRAGVQHVSQSADALAAARRLVQLGLLHTADAQQRAPQSADHTLTAWLHITNACNLRCGYCYVQKSSQAMDEKVGRQAVDAVFRSAVAHGFQQVKLKYAGGEATLNFSFILALHDYAQTLASQHSLELDGVVLSNGVNLTDDMIEALCSRQIRLMISLDGIGEYHDRQRHFMNGRGTFGHIERTLDRLAAHQLVPSISITVTGQNAAGLPSIVDYVLQRGLPFTINFYRQHTASPQTDLVYEEDQVIAAMRETFAVIETNLPPYSLLGALVDRARLDVPHNRACGAGHSYMVIDQHGGIAKCQMELAQKIADVTNHDPLHLIHSDTIGVQNAPIDERPDCQGCTWRYWCAGGCPALTHRATGRYDAQSPNCRIYQALFPEVLRLEGLRLLKYGD